MYCHRSEQWLHTLYIWLLRLDITMDDWECNQFLRLWMLSIRLSNLMTLKWAERYSCHQIYDICVWRKGLLCLVVHDVFQKSVMACMQHVCIRCTSDVKLIPHLSEWMVFKVYLEQHDVIGIAYQCLRNLSTPYSCFRCIFLSLN